MKNKYKLFKILGHKVLMSFVLLLSVSALVAQTTTITPVFVDDFERTDVTTGGVPEVAYTIFKDVGVGDEPADPSTTITEGQLRIPNRKGSGFYGRLGVVGDLSTLPEPFSSKLRETIADSITWAFNIRQNYNFTLSGFSDSKNGVAVILAADNSDFSVANGYALAYGGFGVKEYRLIKFSGGLYSDENITTLVDGQTSEWQGREYMSFRIVYNVDSETWAFYERVDGAGELSAPEGSGSFNDPNVGEFSFNGEEIDSEFTNVDMVSFGFLHNYAGNNDKIMWVDNFSVVSYKTDIGTKIESSQGHNSLKVHSNTNGVYVETENAVVTLYNTLGAIVSSSHVAGSETLNITNHGLYLLKVEFPDGTIRIEKILF